MGQLSTLFGNLSSYHRRSGNSPRPYRRLRRLWLEVLEDRTCPSGSAAAVATTSSLDPSVFGQPVTLTTTVTATSGTGTPTGSVTFLP